MASTGNAREEIQAGDRFAFGANWLQFLDLVDEDRISGAVASLQRMLGVEDLSGQRFLDIGSGSGLFSLAARRMGAEVVSFDFDASSVACTAELRRRFFPGDSLWTVVHGSALDRAFVESLGMFDIVYSWGVLHHTGDLWAALESIVPTVRRSGRLFVSIYNDQGRSSRNWKRIKELYNASGPLGRRLILAGARLHFRKRELDITGAVYRFVRRLPRPTPTDARVRGMDKQRDLVDWVGGWPFEVAKPEQVFDFYRERRFVLDRMITCGGGIGCNEFVFTRQ